MKDTTTGSTIVLTGGTGGIGFGVAKAIVESLKPALLLIISRDAIKNAKYVSELQSLAQPGVQVEGLIYDISTYSTETFLPLLKSKVSVINHLIFAHADRRFFPVVGNNDAAVKQAFEGTANTYSLLNAVVNEKLIPEECASSVTFTSGTLAVRPALNFALMSGIAASRTGIARGFALDIAPIRVNSILPGIVDTTFLGEYRDHLKNHGETRLPVKHIAEPSEIAGLYLVCLQSTYVTGSEFVADGGGLLLS